MFFAMETANRAGTVIREYLKPEFSVGGAERPVAKLPTPGATSRRMRDAKVGFITNQKRVGVEGPAFKLPVK